MDGMDIYLPSNTYIQMDGGIYQPSTYLHTDDQWSRLVLVCANRLIDTSTHTHIHTYNTLRSEYKITPRKIITLGIADSCVCSPVLLSAIAIESRFFLGFLFPYFVRWFDSIQYNTIQFYAI